MIICRIVYNTMLTVYILCVLGITTICARDLENEEGHLQKLGVGRPNLPVEEIHTFPEPREFYENYIIPQKPVLMKGVVKDWKAMSLWTDEYLANVDAPADFRINIEPFLKQVINRGMTQVTFKEFVRTYKTSGHYMISKVPPFLRRDVTVPCSLQCPLIMDENIVQHMMWFSGGGSSGTVHTDAVDNLLCLFRGQKLFTIIDPSKHKVPMNSGAYSDIDQDRVDFVKYPAMAEVEYWHANMTAGDCVFVPYLWIHQVRSFGGNIAVSVWWRHYLSATLDYSTCNTRCDLTVTLDRLAMKGYGPLAENPREVRDQFLNYLAHQDAFDVLEFETSILGAANDGRREKVGVQQDAKKIFAILDSNKDGLVVAEEIKAISIEVYSEFAAIIEALEFRIDRQIDEEKQNKLKKDKMMRDERVLHGDSHTEL